MGTLLITKKTLGFLRVGLSFSLSVAIVLSPPTALATLSGERTKASANQTELQFEKDLQASLKNLGEEKNPEEILKDIQELKLHKSFEEKIANPLDPFSLLTQEVLNKEFQKIQEKREQDSQEDFQDRIKDEVSNYLKILDNKDKGVKYTRELLGKNRLMDAWTAWRRLSPEAIPEPSEEKIEQFFTQEKLKEFFEKVLKNELLAEAIDIHKQEVESFSREYPRQRIVSLRGLRIESSSEKNAEVFRAHAIPSTKKSFTDIQGRLFINNSQPTSFNLTKKNGEALHSFHMKYDSMGFYGDYIVFLTKNKLHFINLEYFQAAVGNTVLPIYTLPLKDPGSKKIIVQNGELVIGKYKIPHTVLRDLSSTYQVIYNILVALTGPVPTKQVEKLLGEILIFAEEKRKANKKLQDSPLEAPFKEGAEQHKVLTESLVKLMKNSPKADPKKIIADVYRNLKTHGINPETLGQSVMGLETTEQFKSLLTHHESSNKLSMVNRHQMASKKLFSRVALLMGHLSHPRPMGSENILRAMAKLLKKPPVTKGASITAAVLTANFFLPEAHSLQMYEILNMAKNAMETVHNYLIHVDYGMNFVRLAGEAGSRMGQGVANSSMYLAPETLPKVLTLGLAAFLVPVLFFAVAQLLVNTKRAAQAVVPKMMGTYKELRKNNAKNPLRKTLVSFKGEFVGYMSRIRKDFDRLQSEQAANEAQINLNDFTDAQNDFVEEMMADEKTFNNSKKTAFTKKVIKNVKEQLDNSIAETAAKIRIFKRSKKVNPQIINTFPQALKQFIFSLPTTTLTQAGLVWSWNQIFLLLWFSIRTSAGAFLTTSTLGTYNLATKSLGGLDVFFMFLIYPKFFSKAVLQKDEKKDLSGITLPTKFNGGLTVSPRWIYERVSLLAKPDTLRRLRRFEDRITSIEKRAHKLALQHSSGALLKKDPSLLPILTDTTGNGNKKLERSMVLKGAVKTSFAIPSINASKVSKKSIGVENLIWFRVCFENMMSEIMNQTLAKLAEVDNPVTEKELKRLFINDPKLMTKLTDSLTLKGDKLHHKARIQMEALAGEIEKDENFLRKVHHEATSKSQKLKRIKINFKHALLKVLSPTKNSRMNLYASARASLNDQKALQRVVRQSVAALFTDISFFLVGNLIFFASFKQGLMTPIHSEFWGPNSWFYGSTYLFVEGVMLGTIFRIITDPWNKIQQDSRLWRENAFDRRISHKDAQKGFWRYLVKQFRSPSNSLAANQIHAWWVLWGNTPAYMAFTGLVIHSIAYGHPQIAILLSGIFIALFTPSYGFKFKILQSFELASAWTRGRVPQWTQSHPRFLRKEFLVLQKRRILFNLFNRVYTASEASFLKIFTLMSSVTYGGIGPDSHGFFWLLFNGSQPNEVIANRIQNSLERLDTVSTGVREGLAASGQVAGDAVDTVSAGLKRL